MIFLLDAGNCCFARLPQRFSSKTSAGREKGEHLSVKVNTVVVVVAALINTLDSQIEPEM